MGPLMREPWYSEPEPWPDWREIMVACLRAFVAIVALGLVLMGFLAVADRAFSQDQPELMAPWGWKWKPSIIGLIEETPISDQAVVTLFRSESGCYLASVIANMQQGIGAFCAPEDWIKGLPQDMRPRVMGAQ